MIFSKRVKAYAVLILCVVLLSQACCDEAETVVIIDEKQTSRNIFKLSLMTLAPVGLLLIKNSVRAEYRQGFLVSAGILSLPAVTGWTVMTIELLYYYNRATKDKSAKISYKASF